MITDKSLMDEWEKKIVKSMAIWDYGPDDAVFTKAYGAPIRPASSPKMKARSPLELLRDYSNAWAEHGVSPPDLVFQTREEGLGFYNACLKSVGGTFTHESFPVNGMCIATVMGVNLIWPEK